LIAETAKCGSEKRKDGTRVVECRRNVKGRRKMRTYTHKKKGGDAGGPGGHKGNMLPGGGEKRV